MPIVLYIFDLYIKLEANGHKKAKVPKKTDFRLHETKLFFKQTFFKISHTSLEF